MSVPEPIVITIEDVPEWARNRAGGQWPDDEEAAEEREPPDVSRRPRKGRASRVLVRPN